jgi:toluene monooxygenase system protein D
MRDAVGPVLRMGEDVDLVVQAIREDNPGREIDVVDHGSYVRVQAQGFLRITLATLRRNLGASFQMRQLESMLSAFAGRITTRSDEIIWALSVTAPDALESKKEGRE